MHVFFPPPASTIVNQTTILDHDPDSPESTKSFSWMNSFLILQISINARHVPLPIPEPTHFYIL